MLAVVLPHADGGQGLVAEPEGVALARGDKRLLGIGVGLGEALQRLQLLHPEPAVLEAVLTHLLAVEHDPAVLIGVERAQVVELAGAGVVAGVPHLEGHVGQRLEGHRVLLDDLDDGPLVVLEVDGVIPVGVEGDELAGRVRQIGRGHGLFRNFVYSGQEVLQLGAARAVRLDLVHGMAVRRPNRENGVRDRLPGVGVVFHDIEVGPLVVFQGDCAGFTREQLHMVLFSVDNVIVYRGGFEQGIHPRLQPFPQNFPASIGGAVQVAAAVRDLCQPEGDALQGGAVRADFLEQQLGQLGVGEHELGRLVGFQLNDALGVVNHIARTGQLRYHVSLGI